MRVKVVQRSVHKKSRNFWPRFLQEFQNSPNSCIEITIGPEDAYVDVHSLQGTILASIRRYHLSNLHTKSSADKVYLFKEGW